MPTKPLTKAELSSFSSPAQMPAHTLLYQAQNAVSNVFYTRLFPYYSAQYIASQKGLKANLLWCYSKAYTVGTVVHQGVSAAFSAANFIISCGFCIGDYLLGWAVRPVADVIYPINPVNGQRHFIGIPRSVEKALGDRIFYPLVTAGMIESQEHLPNAQGSIADKVEGVLKRLKESNQDLLNPAHHPIKFEYRVKTVKSSQINAFAVPGGGMVVYSQIVKEIENAIKNKKIQETTVHFADGSQVTVDLRQVTLDDVLAALLGHEMTHAASRHSIVALMARFLRSVLLTVGRIILIGYLKRSDAEYQALLQKQRSMLTSKEKQIIEDKEDLYTNLNDLFAWIEDKIKELNVLSTSRKNEYEADVTGAYLAQKAKFNPLGALYLQELLGRKDSPFSKNLHKHLEFLFTHPYGENRKRALFAALGVLHPQGLKKQE